MPAESTQIREVRLLNELRSKYGGTGLAGLVGGSVPTVVLLGAFMQVSDIREADKAELKDHVKTEITAVVEDVQKVSDELDAYSTLATQVQVNTNALTRLQEKANEDIKALENDVEKIEDNSIIKADYRDDQNKILVELRNMQNKFDSDLKTLRRDIEADYNRRMDKLETAILENARKKP